MSSRRPLSIRCQARPGPLVPADFDEDGVALEAMPHCALGGAIVSSPEPHGGLPFHRFAVSPNYLIKFHQQTPLILPKADVNGFF